MQAQRIPSLMQDPVLNITITSDTDFGESVAGLKLSQQENRFNVKCALATWRRGYKAYVVTADGQCTSGPDTHTNIVKFGYGLEECSTVPANNKAYLVGPSPFIPPYEGMMNVSCLFLLREERRLLRRAKINNLIRRF